MNRIVMAVALLGAMAAAPACAQTYWRVGAGFSKPLGAAVKDRDFLTGMGVCADIFCSAPDQADHVKGSPILEAGIGYRFTPSLRGEVMFSYRVDYSLDAPDASNALYDADIRSNVFLLNGYYDFAASGDVKPYLGLGVGWAQNRLGTVRQGFPMVTFFNAVSGGKKSNAAFALMAGVSIPQGSWTLDIGYRYIDLGKIESGTIYTSPFSSFPVSGLTGKLRAHELTVGTRF